MEQHRTRDRSGKFHSQEDRQGFQVNPTLWGYVLRSEFDVPPMGLQRYFKAIGLFMAAMVLGLWFLPGAIYSPKVLVLKLGLSLFFGAMAVIFLAAPPRRMRREVQFDLERGEIRAGWLCRRGDFHLENLHGFDDVDVVMLWVDPASPEEANLILRVDGAELGLVVAQGSRAELEPWRLRLARDLAAIARGAGPVAAAAERSGTPVLLGPRLEGEGIAA